VDVFVLGGGGGGVGFPDTDVGDDVAAVELIFAGLPSTCLSLTFWIERVIADGSWLLDGVLDCIPFGIGVGGGFPFGKIGFFSPFLAASSIAMVRLSGNRPCFPARLPISHPGSSPGPITVMISPSRKASSSELNGE
jgi:hypothetical protein